MKLYNQITGEWSGYIPGGIVNDFSHGYKSELLVPSPKEEPIRKKKSRRCFVTLSIGIPTERRRSGVNGVMS